MKKKKKKKRRFKSIEIPSEIMYLVALRFCMYEMIPQNLQFVNGNRRHYWTFFKLLLVVLFPLLGSQPRIFFMAHELVEAEPWIKIILLG